MTGYQYQKSAKDLADRRARVDTAAESRTFSMAEVRKIVADNVRQQVAKATETTRTDLAAAREELGECRKRLALVEDTNASVSEQSCDDQERYRRDVGRLNHNLRVYQERVQKLQQEQTAAKRIEDQQAQTIADLQEKLQEKAGPPRLVRNELGARAADLEEQNRGLLEQLQRERAKSARLMSSAVVVLQGKGPDSVEFDAAFDEGEQLQLLHRAAASIDVLISARSRRRTP